VREERKFLCFTNPVLNLMFLGGMTYFAWTAIQYAKLARFEEPYLSIRPYGLRLNDLPFMSAGMITWDNIKAIEEPGFAFNTSRSYYLVQLKDPSKFRVYPTSSEKLINAILRISSLGFYKGSYLQSRIPVHATNEMSLDALRALIVEKAELRPDANTEKPIKPGRAYGRYSIKFALAIFIVAIGMGWFTNKPQIEEPLTDFSLIKLTEMAEAGDARSQNLLGWRYFRGRGIKKDKEAAFTWWLKSAEQGFTRSESDVGWAYRMGHGIKRDDHQAFAWFLKAAKKDFAYAQDNIGWYYSQGRGIEQDYKKSFYWYKKAADQGNTHAESWLGWQYEKGFGVEKNFNLAIEYYQRAAAKKHKYSIKAVKRLKKQR